MVLFPIELSGDEAQYWDWSRHLQLSYHTKGPLIAWLIAGSTALLGDSELSIRLCSYIAHMIAGIAVGFLGMQLSGGSRRFVWLTSLGFQCIFAYQVADPRRYGVLELDGEGKIFGVVEKPETPPSNWAVTGLYYFDSKVADIASSIKPSARGELEIVDVLKDYLNRRALKVKWLGRGYAWLDTGTHETMLQAAHYIETIEIRQGLKIACLEEIAWRSGYIDVDKFKHLADGYPESSYGRYLKTLAQTALT